MKKALEKLDGKSQDAVKSEVREGYENEAKTVTYAKGDSANRVRKVIVVKDYHNELLDEDEQKK